MRILFVCLGNICRSPTAEAAVRAALADAGLAGRVAVESAGIGSWHVGEPPDARMAAAAARQGLRLDGRARQVAGDDFERFDLLVAMDRGNLRDLQALAGNDEERQRVRLFTGFGDDDLPADVPDPYYDDNFDEVVAIVRAGAAALVRRLQAELDSGR